MHPVLHRPRDPNGFVKYASCNVQLNLNVRGPPWCVIFPTPSLNKAADMDEWDTNLVSNKIKILGYTYSVLVEPLIPYTGGQYPTSTPIRLDLLRFNQESPNQIYNRYTGSHLLGNWYLKPHSFTIPSTITDTISVCSPVNIPLDRTSLGNIKWYDSMEQNAKQNIPIQYNNNQLDSTAYRFDQVHFNNNVKVDCIVDVPDDGNGATVIDLNACVGELPQLFIVTTWNNRATFAPFALTQCFAVTGTIGIIYQDIGTKLSHL